MRPGAQSNTWLSYTVNGSLTVCALEKDRVTLGRAEKNDIRLEDARVSRSHCTIDRVDDGWEVRDNNSANGTFVNDNRVARHRLAHGDRIVVGGARVGTFIFHDQSSPVVFDDDEGTDIRSMVNASLDLRAISSASLPPPPPGAVAQERSQDPPSELFQSELTGPAWAWAIALFSQLGESLLDCRSLDEMLEKPLDMAFKHLPVQRGSVCLYDETQGQMLPMVTRQGRVKTAVRISRSIVNEVVRSRSAILVSDAARDRRFSEVDSIAQMHIHSVMCAPMYHEGRVLGFIYVDSQSAEHTFNQHHLEILAALTVFAAVGVEKIRLREDVEREQEIRKRLARYSSPGVVEKVVASTFGGAMVTEEREVSVLFADLQGFTTMSERMQPPQIAGVLNHIFSLLTMDIFRYGGTLDKFMGDAVMAFFGAPLEQSDHAERAIRAAAAMQESLASFNADHPNRHPLKMRIGINSGRAVVGDIGSPERKDYTVIGDTVNIASRLESSVAEPGQIVVGQRTKFLVEGDDYEFESLGEVALKGKDRPVECFRVLKAPMSVRT